MYICLLFYGAVLAPCGWKQLVFFSFDENGDHLEIHSSLLWQVSTHRHQPYTYSHNAFNITCKNILTIAIVVCWCSWFSNNLLRGFLVLKHFILQPKWNFWLHPRIFYLSLLDWWRHRNVHLVLLLLLAEALL